MLFEKPHFSLKLPDTFFSTLLTCYDPVKEVSGSIKGEYLKNNFTIYFLEQAISKSKKNFKSSFVMVAESIGYFHSHISGNTSISRADKFILFLMTYVLFQPLMLIYTVDGYFIKFTFYRMKRFKIHKVTDRIFNFKELAELPDNEENK